MINFFQIAARVSARPEPKLDLEADQDLPEFRWRTKSAGPGDWIPDMYVKTNEGVKEILKDGDIVGWTGGKKISKEKIKNEDGSRSYIDLEHREVVTSTGFVGWVSFWPYKAENGRGFEPVSKAGTKVVTAGSLSGDAANVLSIIPQDKEELKKLISRYGYKKAYRIVDELEDLRPNIKEAISVINSAIVRIQDLHTSDGNKAESQFGDVENILSGSISKSTVMRQYLDGFNVDYDELPEDMDEDEYLTKKVLDQISVQEVMDA